MSPPLPSPFSISPLNLYLPCTPAPLHSHSSLIAQVPRVVWTLDLPDPADPDNRRLSVIKNNLRIQSNKEPDQWTWQLPPTK